PSSLMIGCYAVAENADLTIDRTELEEADWFTRAEVEAAMRGDDDARFIAPPPHAIACQLLKWWLAR
ncbi:MAG: NADH pyrophosphatase, partial [Proteobacteria bacterium]|nr:NADH pyrophosphatase [Pseudomonadota bacterium]